MRSRIAAAVGLWLGLAVTGFAQTADNPVVVELYTSQGCSSCPPADAILGDLASRDDVIALALHVDYWDYIGWKDVFGDPAHTARQKSYARVAGARSIYTPQMVVGGMDHLVGVKPVELADLIAAHGRRDAPVRLNITREGNTVAIHAEALRALPDGAIVQLVRYRPEATVAIERGENAGSRITYHNIVESWDQIAKWSGAAPLDVSERIAGDEPVVVIVQEPGPGAILAATRLR